MIQRKILLLLILPLLVLTACKDDEDEDMPQPEDMISLDIDNLAASADNEQYEGWIIVNGAPVSTGTFRVDGNGAMSQSEFNVDPDDLEAATAFVLSIEPMPDNDPAPSAIKILGGAFNGNTANVSVAHAAALGNDFSAVSGKFILATPTTNTTDDELSGIWFLDPNNGNPMATLELPTLPDGWIYEGWAVVEGQPVTSGRFSAPSGVDQSAPYSGNDNMGPPFPGEDFVQNAPSGLTFPTDLSGGTLVISIEPDPDNSAKPFAFKPLVGPVPDDATDHTIYDMMDNVTDSFPEGSVMKK